MSKRKKNFGSAPKTHKRRSVASAKVLKVEAAKARKQIRSGNCVAALGSLAQVAVQEGRILAESRGYKKQYRPGSVVGGGSHKTRLKLSLAFARKCLRK